MVVVLGDGDELGVSEALEPVMWVLSAELPRRWLWLDGLDKCSNVIPEGYYFESECDRRCLCESSSFEEYIECSNACYKSKVGGILDDYPED